jgi:hypothetical protein
MSDPVTAAAILGGTGLAGNMVSAFGSPGGAAQIDPAIQAALSQQQNDISQFGAENNAMNQQYQQYIQQYGLQSQQAKQNALNSVLGGAGGAQEGMQSFIQNAFSGQPTDANVNQLAQFDISSGRQMETGRNNVTDMMARTGLDPRSPAYAKVMSDLESQLQVGQGANKSNLQTQMAYNNLNAAMPMYSALQNGPLAGTNLPNAPQTAAQMQNDADYKKYLSLKKAGKFGAPMLAKLGWDKKPPSAPGSQVYGGGVQHPTSIQVPTWWGGNENMNGGFNPLTGQALVASQGQSSVAAPSPTTPVATAFPSQPTQPTQPDYNNPAYGGGNFTPRGRG